MKKTLRKWKLIFVLTLSMAILVVQMPLTALAAPDETISTEEETQTGTIRDEDAPEGEQTEENGPEEGTDKDSEGEEGNEEEAEKEAGDSEGESGKDSEEGEEELREDSEEEVETDIDSADEEEETGEETEVEESEEDEEIEEEEESVESVEEIMLTSASDFVINNGVLKSYTGTEEDIIIPENVVTIGEKAFSNNKTIKTVKFSSNVKTIGDSAFQGCTALKEVTLNEGLETIGFFAFKEAALGEKLSTGRIEPGIIIIPSTVKSIDAGAFHECSYLGEVQFKNGDTKDLMAPSITTWGMITNCPMLTKIELPTRLKSIPEYAFQQNQKLSEVIFGDRVEIVGGDAFYGCSSLKSIDLPASLVTIENYAFSGCSSLCSVDLKEGLVTIGNSAFYGAAFGEKLSSGKIKTGTLVIPSTVQEIGPEAFCNCAYLGEVQFRDGETIVLELGFERVFMKCPMLTRVELPSRLKTIPRETFRGDESLAEVVYGGTIETIGDNAFSGCRSLCSIELKEGLIAIGRNAFNGAAFGEKSSTTGTLVIPSTVQSIGLDSFCDSKYLRKVIFANGDTVVLTMSSVVGMCPELTTVILPERLTKLKYGAFVGNYKLQTLYIPASVTEIEPGAIQECWNLTIYGVPGSAAETYAKQNKIPFKSKDSLKGDYAVKSVKVTPSVIEKIGESAIGETTQLTAKVLPDTAQNRAVSYASDDETVATVDQNGLVTITGYGETKVTVTTADGGKTASCMVVVLKEAIDERANIIEAGVLFPKKKAEYSAVYTGEQIRPTMTVTYPYTDANGRAKTKTLKINVDYTISYRNNVNVGENTADVTIRGIGEYKGVTTKTFTITPKSIRNVTLSQAGDITYGETPSVTVMDGIHELIKDKDYEVVLSTTGSASEDTPSVLTVKGMGNYTGTSKKSAKFNILKTETDIRPIASENISVTFKKLPTKGYTYNGKAQKPAVVVRDTSTGKKVAASNYKVIYTNNINAGTAAVRVMGVSKKGKGYYGISEALTFEIKPKDLSKVKVSTKGLIPKAGTIEDIQKSVEDALTVKDGKHVLSTDEYEIDYGNIRSAGDIKVGSKYPITLTAKAGGNYVEGSQKVYKIKFGQLSFASWTAKINVRIINAEQNEILLRYNGTLLEKGKDYTAVVKKDKKRDTYTVTVKAVKNGAYKGSKTFKKLSAEN